MTASLLKSPELFPVFNNVVVWMVFTRPLISKSSSPFNNPVVTVQRVLITIAINFTFKFHSVFNSLEMSRYLSFFSFSFNFTLWSASTAKTTILQVLFFLLIIRSSRLAEIRWTVCIINIIIIILLIVSFFTPVVTWFFTEICVTTSPVWYPVLFKVFLLILTVLWYEWSRFLLCSPLQSVSFLDFGECTNYYW